MDPRRLSNDPRRFRRGIVNLMEEKRAGSDDIRRRYRRRRGGGATSDLRGSVGGVG